MNDKIISALSKMKSGEELITELSIFPKYDESICRMEQTVRLAALSDLYRVYIPSQMSVEIYSKLYLALLRSLQKKETKAAVRQQYQNYRAVSGQGYSGIMGGSDSFTIIGKSGIGKSSAVSRAISLITENRVIEVESPCIKIVPCVVVQCPFDSSVKGLLLEILRKVDEVLESNYYSYALKARATTDMLIGSVSQVALNHIGLLIVDEIQNVANSKNGKSLIGALTQLINNSGISICMVGTPESTPFFEQALQLARRSVGLQYGALDYSGYFQSFCRVMFQFQYVANRSEITEVMMEWLYEHSSGLVSVIVSLLHDAQEIAILTGVETVNLEILNQAYQQRLSLLHGYIQSTIFHGTQTSRKRKQENICTGINSVTELSVAFSIKALAEKAKAEKLNMVDLLKAEIEVVEVTV